MYIVNTLRIDDLRIDDQSSIYTVTAITTISAPAVLKIALQNFSPNRVCKEGDYLKKIFFISALLI